MSGIDVSEAEERLACEGEEVHDLFRQATRLRQESFGNEVRLCGIINAKSGSCPEDCAFCAQSAHHKTEIEKHALVSAEQMVIAAREASHDKAGRFGVVTSGRALRKKEAVAVVANAVETIAREGEVVPCASLGNVGPDVLQRLAEAGLTRYHHNLETAESFFPEICTTRKYEDAIETIRAAKETGLSVCSGGILGMGESLEQRVELLATVRELDVDSVPLNFLNPIAGTRLEGLDQITPMECLKVIAVARLMMPDKEIRVCGGREHNLRDLQSWIFQAGANGMMIGGYLTIKGRHVSDDLQMIADAGMVVADKPLK